MYDPDTSSHECPSLMATGPLEKTLGVHSPCRCTSADSYTETASTEMPYIEKKRIKKVDYQLAKAVLMESSSITGENLYDHLVEVIKRIIDERPANVVDYFEQFSRSVRNPKLQLRESRDTHYIGPQFYQFAKTFLTLIQTPFAEDDIDYDERNIEHDVESQIAQTFASGSSGTIQRELSQYENILQLQHFWGFCGLGFQVDEIFQLSLAIQKIQYHFAVEKARFWGRIYGLKGSYYIVEADLNSSETEIRYRKMKATLLQDMTAFIGRRNAMNMAHDYDLNLVPGVAWQDYSNEILQKMTPAAAIPETKIEEVFDIIPEPVGVGLNRRTYFVTTALSKEWQELPLALPKHIRASKKVNKFLTGDLEAKLHSYPIFPGTEKNYLRALIARITAGTYIAPEGFYRKMTRKERLLATGEISDQEGEEEDDVISPEEEDEYLGNDVYLTPNMDHVPFSLEELTNLSNWVHVRPNILNQGRVIYLDQERALENLEKRALSRIKASLYEGEVEAEEENEESDEDFESVDYEGEEEEILEDEFAPIEEGPAIFTSCISDTNKEDVPPWTARYSSLYNKTNQMIMMRSNLWPGATTFTFENFCDSIYLGWGVKFVPRCTQLEHIPLVAENKYLDIKFEADDPTVAMEEAWRLHHMKKELHAGEEIDDISVEFDVDDEEDV